MPADAPRSSVARQPMVPAWFAARPVRFVHSRGYRSPSPEQCPCASSISGRPFACSVDSPRSPASISTWTPGEIVLFSGANGAGKTTLLRLLRRAAARCTRARPRCSASTCGVDRRSASGARLALVGHETFCYDDLTVPRTCASRRAPAGRPVAAADAALERLGLDPVADVTHGRLSQGQRRRLSLAVALARDPQLLLLDEPHAGLDEHGRRRARRGRRAPRPPKGAPCCMASHELDLARTLATREVALAAGQVRGRRDRAEARRRARATRSRGGVRMMFVRDALLVAGKDLRIERRSRVALQQILPFGGDRRHCCSRSRSIPTARAAGRVAPGLFWVAVLLAALLAIGRSFAVEEPNGGARRPAALRPRRRLDLPGQGRRDRGRAVPARGGARRRASSCSTASRCTARSCSCARRWPRPSASRPPVPSTACWRPGCALARHSCRCWCCRPSRR